MYDKRKKAIPELVDLEMCPACGAYAIVASPYRKDRFCLKCDWRKDEVEMPQVSEVDSGGDK